MFIEKMHNLWLRVKALFKRRQLDRDLAEELEFHLAMREQKLIAEGMSPRDAWYAARRGFGNAVALKEASRDLWSFPRLETLLQDVRYGLRQFRRNPGFTAVAVLTLALGIGGTTTIFSVVYGALLDPGPYADSGRLAVLVTRDARLGAEGLRWARVSGPEFMGYRDQNHVFDEVIGATGAEALFTGSGLPVWLDGTAATPNAFRVLGVPPLLGRPIIPADARPGAPPVAVLSYKIWRGRFGGDPEIIGRTLEMNHRPTTVVGVMPPRFGWCWELCFPADPSRAAASDTSQAFLVEGHLKPGVTFAQASADVAVLARRFAKLYPKDHPKDLTYTLEPLAKASMGEEQSETLYILLGAVGFLLLISCANIANLLLARASAREREFAIRASLGAGRVRLVRQLVMESLMLALGGAVVGCLLAWAMMKGLVAIIPPGYLDNEAVVRMNGWVLLFTLGTAVVSTILFGLAPALLSVKRNLQETLRAAGRSGGESRGHHWLRNLLVVSEVTLSLVLLTGASLLFRSFWRLQHLKLGYNVSNVLRAGAALPEERYKTAEQRNLLYTQALCRVRVLPGVVSAALGWPTLNDSELSRIEIAGRSSVENRNAWFRLAGDGYFKTLGIPLLAGRTFSADDLADARPVVVVNQAFVNKYFAGASPLGRQIKVKPPAWFPPLKKIGFEIVGVVGNTAHDDGTGPSIQPQVFLPFTVAGISWGMVFVRTTGNPAGLTNPVRRTFAAIDKDLPVEAAAANDDLRGWYVEPRFVMGMLAGFALLGMTLVCVGVYSVLSYGVSQRTHEIGIRMALGAQVADVRRMVLMWGLRWLAVGIGISVPASIVLDKVLRSRIWGITTADPVTLAAVSSFMIVVGLAACYFPARRATKVDPLVALRCE